MSDIAEMVALAEAEVSLRFGKPTALKPRQRDVLHGLAMGENIFAALPTGYGKSLCYWAPAAAWGWRVWVVSPLISLIQDQSLSCENLNLRVGAWHGGMGRAAREALTTRMERGEIQVTFLSPERLMQWWENGFLQRLESLGVGPDLIALDEMHCFEDWRRFRSGYREAFSPIRRLSMRGVPVLGLSASLSKRDADAWMTELCEEHRHLGSNLGRENLVLMVKAIETEPERWLWLISALRDLPHGESALVYCATRTECDEVTRWLKSAGLPACAYHAGLPGNIRSARSKAFRRGALPIVCATTAFGMGVDYPKVSRVIHFSLPHNLESYWQEAGRAGRDGNEAFALALLRRSEVIRARRMDDEAKERFFLLWRAWCSDICRKRAVAEQLGLEQDDCGTCDHCSGKQHLPAWMEKEFLWPDKTPWWIEPAAHPVEWGRGKIFSRSEKS